MRITQKWTVCSVHQQTSLAFLSSRSSARGRVRDARGMCGVEHAMWNSQRTDHNRGTDGRTVGTHLSPCCGRAQLRFRQLPRDGQRESWKSRLASSKVGLMRRGHISRVPFHQSNTVPARVVAMFFVREAAARTRDRPRTPHARKRMTHDESARSSKRRSRQG